MKRFLLMMVVLFSGVLSAQAQTAADLNEGQKVVKSSTTGVFTFSWWGKAGRTYFIQQSFDLIHWQYVPSIESGADAVCGLNFSCSDPRQFWRLKYTDASTGGLSGAAADFDDDGLTNALELAAGTEPFNRDSDDDGYYDGQEIANDSNPLSSASAPNENLAQLEDDTMIEQAVGLFEQSRVVSNDWYAGYAAPSSTVSWFDYSGTEEGNGYETYQGTAQRWSTAFAATQYPQPSISPFTYYDSGTTRMAEAELREFTGGGDVIGHAYLQHHRVGLYSNPTLPAQPWIVSRQYVTYRKTLPATNSSNAVPVFANVDVVSLFIQKGRNRTRTGPTPAPDNAFYLEPPATMSKVVRDFIGSVSVTPSTSPLALDATGEDLWITLPAGGIGVQMGMWQPINFDVLTYKVVGGGTTAVTPATSSNPFPNWPLYYESYSGTSAGTASALHAALDDGTGNLTVSTKPLLKFDVREPKELNITLRIIGRNTGSGIVDPAAPPTKAALEAYLDSVFVPQVNVHTHVTIMPQVNVVFDVGLKQSWGSKNRGVGNGNLGILQGQYSDAAKQMQSDEETAIMNAAPADAGAAITLYWVACTGMDAYDWGTDPDVETAGNSNKLIAKPALGTAGKAWDHFRINNDIRPRVIWLMGRDQTYYQNNAGTQEHTIAHELGHALGNLTHTIEKYGSVPGGPPGQPPFSGHSYFSDNNKRLMSGMPGPKRAAGPKQLNKLERDKISEFIY